MNIHEGKGEKTYRVAPPAFMIFRSLSNVAPLKPLRKTCKQNIEIFIIHSKT